MPFLRKLFRREELSWATDRNDFPDFGLSRIEMKLLAGLVFVQTFFLSLLLL